MAVGLCFRSTSAFQTATRRNWAIVLDGSTKEESGETLGLINGDHGDKIGDSNEAKIEAADLLPEAPALSYKKYLSMQEKRVFVTIRYGEKSGWKPYFLTVAKKIKEAHPDVIIERRILPRVDNEETFEILVDGKFVEGSPRKWRAETRSVFVSMVEIDLAISKARRRKRPTTTYGDRS